MIHLKLDCTDQMKAYLQDVTEGKNENKFCFAALRAVAERWNRPYLDLERNKKLVIGDRVITYDDYLSKRQNLVDMEGGELVLGKIAVNLENAYAIVKTISPQIVTMNINDWCREIINEAIVTEKDTQDRKELKEEEEHIE